MKSFAITMLLVIAILLVWAAVVWQIAGVPNSSAPVPVGKLGGAEVKPTAVAAVEATGRVVPIPPTRPVATHASRSRYGGVFILNATAYTWTGHRTASGLWPRRGLAASNLFPLGTVLDVEGFGRVVVEDRIGCCSQLDIFFPTERECVRFGRRQLQVEVVR